MKPINLINALTCRNCLEGLIQKTGSWIFRKHFIVVASEKDASYVTDNTDYLFYCKDLESLRKMLIEGRSVCITNDFFLKLNSGLYRELEVNFEYRIILNDLLTWKEQCLKGVKNGYTIDSQFLSLFDTLAVVSNKKSFVDDVASYCNANGLKLNVIYKF